jgi:hypothetical protein
MIVFLVFFFVGLLTVACTSSVSSYGQNFFIMHTDNMHDQLTVLVRTSQLA